MEEIKVGEYVRTIDGYIRKVIQVNKKGTYEGLCYGAYSVDKKYKNSIGISAKKIKSHSPNIIDLIEEGDYVNGWEVQEKLKDNEGKWYVGECCGDSYYDNDAYNDEIETIVTKEQFNTIEYKLEN